MRRRPGDRHDPNKKPIMLRLPPDLATQLEAFATTTDQARHALIVRWVREGLDREAGKDSSP